MAGADLVAAQRNANMQATWLTADRYPTFQRDRGLRKSVSSIQPSLAHVHGLWRSPTRIANTLAKTGLPLVIAPHGMLNPMALAHSRWKKFVVWHLWESRALSSARCLHALCPAEATAIKSLLPEIPIAVIPNGVALPSRATGGEPDTPRPPYLGKPSFLLMGRFCSSLGVSIAAKESPRGSMPGRPCPARPNDKAGGWPSWATATAVHWSASSKPSLCPVARPLVQSLGVQRKLCWLLLGPLFYLPILKLCRWPP